MPRLKAIAKLGIEELERILAEKKAQAAQFLRKERDRIDAELARLTGQSVAAPIAPKKRGRPAGISRTPAVPRGRKRGRRATGVSAKVIAALKESTKPMSAKEIAGTIHYTGSNLPATLAQMVKTDKIIRGGDSGSYTYTVKK